MVAWPRQEVLKVQGSLMVRTHCPFGLCKPQPHDIQCWMLSEQHNNACVLILTGSVTFYRSESSLKWRAQYWNGTKVSLFPGYAMGWLRKLTHSSSKIMCPTTGAEIAQKFRQNMTAEVLQVQYIGYFDTEEEAAVAYDKEILRQRGPAAQTNYPLVRLRLEHQVLGFCCAVSDVA